MQDVTINSVVCGQPRHGVRINFDFCFHRVDRDRLAPLVLQREVQPALSPSLVGSWDLRRFPRVNEWLNKRVNASSRRLDDQGVFATRSRTARL